jgi:hypothetical protein
VGRAERSFNALNTFGYAFGDSGRSDYFYNSFHLDYDVANAHRFYPRRPNSRSWGPRT